MANMRLSISNMLTGVLAMGQLTCALAVHPQSPSNHTTGAPLRCTYEDDSCTQYGVERRMNPANTPRPLRMESPNGWGTTWTGYVKEPPLPIPAWTRNTIRAYAKEGYEMIMASGNANEVTIVSAVWSPGRGVWLGSIPHGAGAAQFPPTCRDNAPRLWRELEHRTPIDTPAGEAPTLWHAEDMALLEYERTPRHVVVGGQPSRGNYPVGMFIASYGRRFRNEGPKVQPPCSGREARITPNCFEVLRTLDVHHQ
ncbi:hypothetical protein K458DRAFT_471206 [Lentithecium fluviatile CBS 122367]|uniref:Uncharacterized protein n=1 Tax=Lentithecium fluviatile CBS 122367 TaxID=1168545 RepID=A0A6G1IBV9_9PLEO|nr:hypothetical protein K458DRAFT_471206 [Lentithecium fluviatile CBS 122367]